MSLYVDSSALLKRYVRTLDALHLAAARRLGPGSTCLLTFDIRQAQAARSLGMTVLGG